MNATVINAQTRGHNGPAIRSGVCPGTWAHCQRPLAMVKPPFHLVWLWYVDNECQRAGAALQGHVWLQQQPPRQLFRPSKLGSVDLPRQVRNAVLDRRQRALREVAFRVRRFGRCQPQNFVLSRQAVLVQVALHGLEVLTEQRPGPSVRAAVKSCPANRASAATGRIRRQKDSGPGRPGRAQSRSICARGGQRWPRRSGGHTWRHVRWSAAR